MTGLIQRLYPITSENKINSGKYNPSYNPSIYIKTATIQPLNVSYIPGLEIDNVNIGDTFSKADVLRNLKTCNIVELADFWYQYRQYVISVLLNNPDKLNYLFLPKYNFLNMPVPLSVSGSSPSKDINMNSNINNNINGKPNWISLIATSRTATPSTTTEVTDKHEAISHDPDCHSFTLNQIPDYKERLTDSNLRGLSLSFRHQLCLHCQILSRFINAKELGIKHKAKLSIEVDPYAGLSLICNRYPISQIETTYKLYGKQRLVSDKIINKILISWYIEYITSQVQRVNSKINDICFIYLCGPEIVLVEVDIPKFSIDSIKWGQEHVQHCVTSLINLFSFLDQMSFYIGRINKTSLQFTTDFKLILGNLGSASITTSNNIRLVPSLVDHKLQNVKLSPQEVTKWDNLTTPITFFRLESESPSDLLGWDIFMRYGLSDKYLKSINIYLTLIFLLLHPDFANNFFANPVCEAFWNYLWINSEEGNTVREQIKMIKLTDLSNNDNNEEPQLHLLSLLMNKSLQCHINLQ